MCGLAGIIGCRERQIGARMVSKLKHRGPDHSSIWSSPEGEYPALIVHTRLSILDISDSSNQPFESRDKRYILAFNGEIYNFLELRSDLELRGYQFKSESDTEVLLYGLIADGLEFLVRCNGMWAFCLWDRKEKKAVFSRDRFGVKPLFYTLNKSNCLAFSSEMKGLAPVLGTVQPSKEIDHIFNNQFNYEATEYCSIDGVKRLPPGHTAIYQDGKLRVYRWWNTLDNLSSCSASYDQQIEQWRDLFLDAVQIRMRSDVRIGSALSGGLDSSSVLAAMAHIDESNSNSEAGNRITDDWKHAVCSTYPGSSLDETACAQQAASSCNVTFHSVVIDSNLQGLSMQNILAQVEDPYLTLPYPMLETYRRIKSLGISVTLDGHGADELFSGYGMILQGLKCVQNFSEYSEIIAIDESTRTGVYSAGFKAKRKEYLKSKIKKFLQGFGFRPKNWLHNLSTPRVASEIANAYQAEIELIKKHPAYHEMDAFSQALYELFHLSILPTLLRNYDRYSMANSVEVRMPFMDWRLVALTFSLPFAAKLGGGYTKRIQRDALSGILDEAIRTRRDKIGWNAPMHEWFAGPLSRQLQETLAVSNSVDCYPGASTALSDFQQITNPTFEDGQALWNKVLPVVWLDSLSSSVWSASS